MRGFGGCAARGEFATESLRVAGISRAFFMVVKKVTDARNCVLELPKAFTPLGHPKKALDPGGGIFIISAAYESAYESPSREFVSEASTFTSQFLRRVCASRGGGKFDLHTGAFSILALAAQQLRVERLGRPGNQPVCYDRQLRAWHGLESRHEEPRPAQP